jgi:hypothetical protein
MKRALFLSLALAASACGGGNWSNRDLEYLNALPSRDTLKSKLPTNENKQGLAVGDPSKTYLDTKKASTDFNNILELILTVIETVRSLPPTTRGDDSRTWGPWPDQQNPGWSSQVTITKKSDELFEFEFRHLNTSSGKEFVSTTGQFKPTANLRRGQGVITINAGALTANLPSAAAFKGVQEVSIGYMTETFPTRVEMSFSIDAGTAMPGLSGIGYTYREQADKSGRMRFEYRTTATEIRRATVDARWLPSGSGRATTRIEEGQFAGATQEECWDAAFKIVYLDQSWTGGLKLGLIGACPNVEGL